jgi:hypothetical protein
VPIVLYSAPTRSKREETQLRRLLGTVRLKEVQSPERLLDEVLLMLHRPVDQLPDARRGTIAALYDNDAVLAGRKVLVVDDDIRNIFALTSVLNANAWCRPRPAARSKCCSTPPTSMPC